MRLPKTVDQFVSALNDMLAEGKDTTLQNEDTLKAVDRLLGAVAPGYYIVTVQSIGGQLLGFSAQQSSTHEQSAPAAGLATPQG